ncbi:MAG: hypothetical protein ACI4KR_10990, partial [Ruminiclostridium sp.]
MTTDEKNIFTEDDFDGDIDFDELEDEEFSEAETVDFDEEEEQADTDEDSASSPEFEEDGEEEQEEAAADEADEPYSGEYEENDTVAMVFRNSERVQHNKAVDYSALPVTEAEIEIPVREVHKAPPVHNARKENSG